jgi:hypothetical protein
MTRLKVTIGTLPSPAVRLPRGPRASGAFRALAFRALAPRSLPAALPRGEQPLGDLDVALHLLDDAAVPGVEKEGVEGVGLLPDRVGELADPPVVGLQHLALVGGDDPGELAEELFPRVLREFGVEQDGGFIPLRCHLAILPPFG